MDVELVVVPLRVVREPLNTEPEGVELLQLVSLVQYTSSDRQ
jgi:hypothetical protein